MIRNAIVALSLLIATPVFAGDLQAELDRRLAAFVKDHHLPGATAAILKDGVMVRSAAGFDDVEAGRRMRPDAVMPCGSIGKTFVAALALEMELKGEIDLDRTLDHWLGDEPWLARLANGRTATLRMLLNHSGGIADHRHSQGFIDGLSARLKTLDDQPDFLIPPRELVSYVLDQPASSPAGQGWSYSETGYVLAGLILEKQSGKPVFDLIQARLLTPLKLEGVRPALSRRTARLVNGYVGENPVGLPRKTVADGALRFSPATEFTGGGLYCSSGDLVRWASALYEGRALRSKGYLDELTAGAPIPQAPGMSWGLGVSMAGTPPDRRWGHGGEFPGYKSMMSYAPDRRVAFAAQVNSDADGAALQDLGRLLEETAGLAALTAGSDSR